MNKTKPTPHDAFLKLLLDNPRSARDFFQRLLPKGLVKQLDLDSLAPESTSFVSPSLKTTFSDAVFSVRMKGGEGHTALVSILLEHKSHPDKWAAVQLLAYLAEGYRRQVKNLRKQKKDGMPQPLILKPIIPFLFYQGGKPWAFPRLRRLFGAAHNPLLRYVPDFETVFISLYEMDDAKIARIGVAWLRAALLTQKYSHDPEALFKRLAPILQAMHHAMDGNFSLSFFIYISRSLDLEPEDFKKLVEALPPDSNPQTMDTLYDKLMAKGRKEGLEIGLEQGLEKGREQGLEQGLEQGIEQGLEKGLEQGLEKGLEQGLEQGREQGSEQAKKEAVLSGLRLGISVQTLSLMTGFSEEKVRQIFQEDQSAAG